MARDIEADIKFNDKTAAGLKSAEQNLKKSNERIKKETDKLGGSLIESVSKVSPAMGKVLTKGFSLAAASAGPILGGIGLVAAPLIGAAVSGAIIGGAGIGGVLGGVALVSKDPRVQAAGQNLGKTLMQGLQKDAGVFLEPVLQSIGQIEQSFERMRPRIQSILKDSSAFVGPLTGGVTQLVDGVLRGVAALTSKGLPVMRAIGDLAGSIGEGVGDALETISGGSEEAALAIRDLGDLLEGVIKTAGYVVRGLTEVYGVIRTIGTEAGLAARSIFTDDQGAQGEFKRRVAESTGALADLSNQAHIGSGFVEVFGVTIADTGSSIVTFEQQMRALNSTTGNLFNATTNAADAVANMKSALSENGKTLDENTAKGRANRNAISSVANAFISQYEAAVRVNGVGPKTDAVLQSNYNKFIQLATGITGSKTRAQELAKQLGVLPPVKDIKVNAQTGAAANNLREVVGLQNSIQSKTVTYNVRVRRTGEKLYGNQAPMMAGNDYSTGEVTGNYRTGGPKTIERVVPTTLLANITVDGVSLGQRSVAVEVVNQDNFQKKYRRS